MTVEKERERPARCRRKYHLQARILSSETARKMINAFVERTIVVVAKRILRSDGTRVTRLTPTKHFKKAIKAARDISDALGVKLMREEELLI